MQVTWNALPIVKLVLFGNFIIAYFDKYFKKSVLPDFSRNVSSAERVIGDGSENKKIPEE